MKYIVSMASYLNKWFLASILPTFLIFNGNSFHNVEPRADHPFHVSIIEINHNASEKSLEISCKIFTDDFEKSLARNYNTKVDLINPPNKPAMDSLVKKYLFNHLAIKVNGKPVSFNYVGFEHEGEAVYGYIEGLNISSVSKVDISTNIMYDFFDDQVNIMHFIVNGNRKSTKLNYPDKETSFSF